MGSHTAAQQARPRRRWYQFSLRALLAFVTLIVLGLAAWRSCVEPYRHEREAISLVADLGARYAAKARGPAWVRRVRGPIHCQALTFVDLGDCDEPNRYLPAITRCRWLEVLVVGGDAVGDQEAAEVCRLTGLKGLVLDSTRVTDNGLQALREAIPRITIHQSQRRAIAAFRQANRESSIRIRSVARPSVFPEYLDAKHLDVVTDMYLSSDLRPQVTDVTLDPVRSFIELESVSIKAQPTDQFTDSGLQNLAATRNLRRLSLRASQITDHGLAWLKTKTTLEELHLWQTAVTDRGLSELPLDGLKKLDLSETKVTDAGLVTLGQCQELRFLGLQGTAISDKGLAALEGLAKLERISLRGTQITDDGLIPLSKVRSLQVVDLGETRITNAGLPRLKALRELRDITLGGTMVDGKGLHDLQNFAKLESLNLGTYSAKSRIDDLAMAEVAKLRGLRRLRLHGTSITDGALTMLHREPPTLEFLAVDCTGVSQEAIRALIAARPRVSVLWSVSEPPAGRILGE